MKQMIQNAWNAEPIVIIKLGKYVVLFAVAMGWIHNTLSTEQATALGLVLDIAAGVLTRQNVVSPATINQAGQYVSDIVADAKQKKDAGVPPVGKT